MLKHQVGNISLLISSWELHEVSVYIYTMSGYPNEAKMSGKNWIQKNSKTQTHKASLIRVWHMSTHAFYA